MTTKQIILSIEYYALKKYFDAGTKRLKKSKKPTEAAKLALEELSTVMKGIARDYQAQSGVQPMDAIIPPPPPPPPPEDWP
jgi:hypothetical protein